MNIFLDANSIFRDPFLTKGYNKILKELAMHNDVKIYISKVVYKEVQRGHKVFLEQELQAAQNSLNKISPYLDKSKQKFTLEIDLEDLLEDFENHIQKLQIENILEIICYDADVLKHIVEIDMYEKKPFIKKQEITNKNGDKVRINKKEIRDAIIWYSYQEFIKKNKLENCYFISNNTKEFADEGISKSLDNEPYSLHPELIGGTNFIAYKNIQAFITHNNKKVKEYIEDINNERIKDYLKIIYKQKGKEDNQDINFEILSEIFSDAIKERLENGYAEDLLYKFYSDQIFSEARDFLADKQPENLHHDYFMNGYVDPTFDGEITEIRLKEVDIYGEEITVSVDVDVEIPVEIYLYNPVYDDRDEKFQYYSTDTIRVLENVVFVIPIDTEKEIDEENFSLSEYLEGIKPENLNIEIIEWENVNHKDMFPEDDYEDYYM